MEEQQAITTLHGKQPTKEQQSTLTRGQRWIGAVLILLTIFGVKELVHSHHQQQQLDRQVQQIDSDTFTAQSKLYEACVQASSATTVQGIYDQCGPLPSPTTP
jgi:hypothetical protein